MSALLLALLLTDPQPQSVITLPEEQELVDEWAGWGFPVHDWDHEA